MYSTKKKNTPTHTRLKGNNFQLGFLNRVHGPAIMEFQHPLQQLCHVLSVQLRHITKSQHLTQTQYTLLCLQKKNQERKNIIYIMSFILLTHLLHRYTFSKNVVNMALYQLFKNTLLCIIFKIDILKG